MVTRIYPYSNPSSGRFKNRSIYAAGRGDLGSGRCGLFNIRGHGRGRGGRGGRARGVNFQGGCGGGSGAHEMEFKSQMSPVTLKIQSWPNSQTIQGKGSLKTRYAQSFWKIKRGAPPDLSVPERTTRTGWSIRSSLGFKTQAEMNLDWQEGWPVSLPMGEGHKCMLKIEAVILQTETIQRSGVWWSMIT